VSSTEDNSIQFNSIQFKSCSLTCILHSTLVITKPAQEHKCSTRTGQIYNSKTLKGQSKSNMAVAGKEKQYK
jgi:hypothetical protein